MNTNKAPLRLVLCECLEHPETLCGCLEHCLTSVLTLLWGLGLLGQAGIKPGGGLGVVTAEQKEKRHEKVHVPQLAQLAQLAQLEQLAQLAQLCSFPQLS